MTATSPSRIEPAADSPAHEKWITNLTDVVTVVAWRDELIRHIRDCCLCRERRCWTRDGGPVIDPPVVALPYQGDGYRTPNLARRSLASDTDDEHRPNLGNRSVQIGIDDP